MGKSPYFNFSVRQIKPREELGKTTSYWQSSSPASSYEQPHVAVATFVISTTGKILSIGDDGVPTMLS